MLKDKLRSFEEIDGRIYVRDQFKVADIKYDGDKISSVTIDVSFAGTIHDSITFTHGPSMRVTVLPAESAVGQNCPKMATASPVTSSGIADDEVILIGNCRGKKYGEVKE
mgnify:FL=1